MADISHYICSLTWEGFLSKCNWRYKFLWYLNTFCFCFYRSWAAEVEDGSSQPHLQIPGLFHILPQHVFSQVVKHTGLYRGVWGAQTWFLQSAHQPVRIFAVKLAELCWPTVRLPSCDAVRPVELLLYGVMVEIQAPHHRQDVASETAQTLSQQEEAVSHPCQLQMLLGVWATDAAIVKRQLDSRVSGHGGSRERGAGSAWMIRQTENLHFISGYMQSYICSFAETK